MGTRIELCIPAYNETDIIAESIHIVKSALSDLPYEWHITVADNGSTDGTKEAAEALQEPNVRVLSIPERGKGIALATAARASRAGFFGFIDADLSANPKAIGEFIHFIETGEADIVIGSRLINARSVQRGFLRSLSSRLFNALRRFLLDIPVADSQCGFKVMNVRGRELLAQCTEKGWFLDLEFLRRAEIAGLVIKEIPIEWTEQQFPGRKGKLNMITDGYGALFAILRIRRLVKAI